jgi:hypothetical protein
MEWKNVGKDTVNSQCINAEYLDSDYSKKPRNSGNRTNIGRYGNTERASISGNRSGYIVWYD